MMKTTIRLAAAQRCPALEKAEASAQRTQSQS